MHLFDTIRHFSLPAIYALALIVAAITATLYRSLLHPLHSYPGPFLAKITDLYGGVLAAKKRLPLVITDLHERYGAVVRVGPNRLLFNSAKAFQDIYQNDEHITKSWTYELLTRDNVFTVFNTLDGDAHRAKRRVIGHALSKRAMNRFEPTLIGEVDVFLDILRRASKKGTPVNMTQRLDFLALDIIALLGMGFALNTQTTDENRLIREALAISLFVGNIGHHFPTIHKLLRNRMFNYLTSETKKKFTRVVEKMVRFRLSLDTHARPDLFSFVAEALPKEAAKTPDSAIWKESLVLCAAGGNIVASGMTSVFFYLSRNPSCYKRLAKEIRTKFPNGSSIKGGFVLQSCRYLRACIDESLRMSPPIPTNLWRQQVATDNSPLTIDGHYIPKGTLFGVNVYALNHNPEIFPDPHTFDPQRWLGDDASTKKTMEGFASFSAGERDCAGKQLGYLELSIVIAKTLWYFDFEKASGLLGDVGEGHDRGRPAEFEIHDGFSSTHDGPYLVFHARE